MTDNQDNKTVYVSRRLLNGNDVYNWAITQGIPRILDPSMFHTTIAYSKGLVDWQQLPTFKDPANLSLVVTVPSASKHETVPSRKLRLLGEENNAIVLGFKSPQLTNEWKDIMNLGATWDWKSYDPHITLSYNWEGPLPDDIVPYTGELHFSQQIVAELETNWGG